VDLLDSLLADSIAELSAGDRAHVLGHLEASSRWLTLLAGRLADGGEPEAAALVDAARQDIDAVCQRLGRTTSGLPVDPHRASTPVTPLAVAGLSQSGGGVRRPGAVPALRCWQPRERTWTTCRTKALVPAPRPSSGTTRAGLMPSSPQPPAARPSASALAA